MSEDERFELEKELARLSREYLHAWETENELDKYLAAGMMLGQLARIYRLDVPAGLMPIEHILKEIGRKLVEPEDPAVLRKALYAVEWVYDGEVDRCPSCGMRSDVGHDWSCTTAAALGVYARMKPK